MPRPPYSRDNPPPQLPTDPNQIDPNYQYQMAQLHGADPAAQYMKYLGDYGQLGPQAQQSLDVLRANAMGGPGSANNMVVNRGLQQAQDYAQAQAASARGQFGIAQAPMMASQQQAMMAQQAARQKSMLQAQAAQDYYQGLMARRAQVLQASNLPLQYGSYQLGQQGLSQQMQQFQARQNQQNVNALVGAGEGFGMAMAAA
jgi:hypothetical protein